MKHFGTAAMIILSFILACTFAFAAGNAEKGKALFNDAKLSESHNGNSCNYCHPDGKGLEDSIHKKEWKLMGKKYYKLEDAINIFIEKAMHGKPLDPNSEEMLDLVAYISSLHKD